MPGRDGRGPAGMGPVGRRMGPCNRNVTPVNGGKPRGCGMGYYGGRRGRRN